MVPATGTTVECGTMLRRSDVETRALKSHANDLLRREQMRKERIGHLLATESLESSILWGANDTNGQWWGSADADHTSREFYSENTGLKEGWEQQQYQYAPQQYGPPHSSTLDRLPGGSRWHSEKASSNDRRSSEQSTPFPRPQPLRDDKMIEESEAAPGGSLDDVSTRQNNFEEFERLVDSSHAEAVDRAASEWLDRYSQSPDPYDIDARISAINAKARRARESNVVTTQTASEAVDPPSLGSDVPVVAMQSDSVGTPSSVLESADSAQPATNAPPIDQLQGLQEELDVFGFGVPAWMTNLPQLVPSRWHPPAVRCEYMHSNLYPRYALDFCSNGRQPHTYHHQMLSHSQNHRPHMF